MNFLGKRWQSRKQKGWLLIQNEVLDIQRTKLAETVPLKYNARLIEKLSDEILQKHLVKLISVLLIFNMHDGVEPKVKMLYFLKNGTVVMLSEHETFAKELERT